MIKFNKRECIKRIVIEPNSQKRVFWAREMKMLNELIDRFPNLDFWIRASFQKVPSLSHFKSKYGIEKISKLYKEFNYIIPPKVDIILGEKTGKDKILSKKAKTIRQFIDE